MGIDDLATLQLNRRRVTVVHRGEDDDLVARVHQGGHGREDRLRRPGSDGDFGIHIVRRAIQRTHLGGNGLTQHRHAGHGGVLVVAGAGVLVEQRQQLGGRIKVRKALREVDGAVLAGQRGHHREDGGADLGQAGGEGAGVSGHARSLPLRLPGAPKGSCDGPVAAFALPFNENHIHASEGITNITFMT